MIRIVKIGSGVIDDGEALAQVLDSISATTDPVVLVHGGGKLATTMAERLGVPQTMVEGRRVTDEQTLQIVTMVYAGWINKTIVAQLQSRNMNVIGVCGADNNLILAKQRDPISVDYGCVGDVVRVNDAALRHLLHHYGTKNSCVVVAPITHDGKGNLLNTNADTIAAELALALVPSVELIYVFEHPGVMRDVRNPNSIIASITKQQAHELQASGHIHSGMLPKLDNAFRAVERGLKNVRIARYDAIHTAEGTWIR